jgi:hypothetical protein
MTDRFLAKSLSKLYEAMQVAGVNEDNSSGMALHKIRARTVQRRHCFVALRRDRRHRPYEEGWRGTIGMFITMLVIKTHCISQMRRSYLLADIFEY